MTGGETARKKDQDDEKDKNKIKMQKKYLKEKIQRMRERKNKVKFLLYPEDPFKENWDFFIILILIVTCITTPLRITFG